jgi:hypothetical protein
MVEPEYDKIIRDGINAKTRSKGAKMKKLALSLFVLFCLVLPANQQTFANITPDMAQEGQPLALDQNNPRIKKVVDVQNRHTKELMAIKGVVGTATGVNDAGDPSVVIFTSAAPKPGSMPGNLEGIPVAVKVTGPFEVKRASGKQKSATFKTTAVLLEPVPIGVSTGNIGQCEAGTISARVKDGSGHYYALGNNHVYALENTASIGSEILQPGLYDTHCRIRGNNDIGSLSNFVTIDFSGGDNTVDAAIALSSRSQLGNSTPSNGYGTPSSTTATPTIGRAVQKYGRTTQLTKGSISAINARVTVSYGNNQNAVFVNQIIVTTSGAFIKAGDSGSLLVTNDAAANPVGLLFAGNSSGTYSIANPISAVLDAFGVTIDGK